MVWDDREDPLYERDQLRAEVARLRIRLDHLENAAELVLEAEGPELSDALILLAAALAEQ